VILVVNQYFVAAIGPETWAVIAIEAPPSARFSNVNTTLAATGNAKQHHQPKVREYVAGKQIAGTRPILIETPYNLGAFRSPESSPEALPLGKIRVIDHRLLGLSSDS
jgi:hypothetical protein